MTESQQIDESQSAGPPPAGQAAPAGRRNQALGLTLGIIAVTILVVVVALMLVIRYEHLPSLLENL